MQTVWKFIGTCIVPLALLLGACGTQNDEALLASAKSYISKE
jgi:hypothetical protein